MGVAESSRVEKVIWPAAVTERPIVGARLQNQHAFVALLHHQPGNDRSRGATADDDSVDLVRDARSLPVVHAVIPVCNSRSPKVSCEGAVNLSP